MKREAGSQHPDGMISHRLHDFVEPGDVVDLSANEYLGRVSLDQLPAEVLHPEAKYYICGPGPFIRQHYRYLVDRGVDRSNIHFEEFGPLTLSVN